MGIKRTVLALVLLAIPVTAQGAWRHRPGPREPPPSVIVETPRSRPGYIWVGGHHEWRHRRYVWVGGHPVRERRHHHWEDGRWDHHEDHYDWHPGGWRMER